MAKQLDAWDAFEAQYNASKKPSSAWDEFEAQYQAQQAKQAPVIKAPEVPVTPTVKAPEFKVPDYSDKSILTKEAQQSIANLEQSPVADLVKTFGASVGENVTGMPRAIEAAPRQALRSALKEEFAAPKEGVERAAYISQKAMQPPGAGYMMDTVKGSLQTLGMDTMVKSWDDLSNFFKSKEQIKRDNDAKMQADLVLANTPHVPGLQQLADWGKQQGKSVRDTISEHGKLAQQNSQISGNLVKAIRDRNMQELSFGKDPSVLGYAMNATEVLGSLAPMVAASVITKSPNVATAMGYAQSASEGIDTAKNYVDGLTDEQLAQNSPYFREMIARGIDPKMARKVILDKTEENAAQLQGAVGAFGGKFTGELVTGGFDKVLNKFVKNKLAQIAVGGAASATEEGIQEFSEGVAADLGINKEVVKEIGADSFANLILGAIGGVPVGAIAGATAKKEGEEPQVTPPAAPEAVAPAEVPVEAPVVEPTPPGVSPAIVSPEDVSAPELVGGQPIQAPQVEALPETKPVEAAPVVAAPVAEAAPVVEPRAQMEETLAKLKEDQAALKEKIAAREPLPEELSDKQKLVNQLKENTQDNFDTKFFTKKQYNHVNKIIENNPDNPQVAKDLYDTYVAQQSRIKAERSERARQNVAKSKIVNPETDDILTAIAKLGGIKTADALKNGFDPKEITAAQIGSGISPTFHSGPKARNIESMREALAQEGYIPFDSTEAEIIDFVDRAVSGERILTPKGEEYHFIQQQKYEAEQAAAKAAAEQKAMEEANAKLAEAGMEEREQAALAKVYEEPAAPMELTGQTEAEIKAEEKAKAEAAKEEAKKAAAPPAEEFALTGSKREADLAAAQGAQDLFVQPKEEKVTKPFKQNISLERTSFTGRGQEQSDIHYTSKFVYDDAANQHPETGFTADQANGTVAGYPAVIGKNEIAVYDKYDPKRFPENEANDVYRQKNGIEVGKKPEYVRIGFFRRDDKNNGIEHVVVSNAYRREGVGSAILDSAKAQGVDVTKAKDISQSGAELLNAYHGIKKEPVKTQAEINRERQAAKKEKAAPKFNKQKILDDVMEHQYAFETKAQLKAYAKKLIKQGYYTEEQLAGHEYLFKDRDMGVEDIYGDFEQEIADNLDKLERGESIEQIKPANIEPKGKVAGLTDARIDALIREYAYMQNGREDDTKAMIATVNPKDFLAASTTGAEDIERIREKAKPIDIEQMRAASIPPTFWVEVNERGNIQITGHEGRHRMMAMADAGVTSVPVVLKFISGDTRSRIESMKLFGQTFYGIGYGQNIRVTNAIPLSWNERNNIKDEYGIKNKKVSEELTFNIEPVERTDKQMAEQSESDREEVIQEYRVARAAGRRAIKKVAAEGSNLRMQKELNELLAHEERLRDYLDLTKPRNNRAVDFMLRATQELQKGNLDPDVEAVVRSIYEKYPHVLEGLKLSVRSRKDEGRDSGNFNPWTRVVTLWKDGSGVENPKTVRHELMHSLEQLMTPQAKQDLIEAWFKALQRAMKENTDEPSRKYFEAIGKFLEDPSQETLNKAVDIAPYELYQYINPSEFWAVNAEKLMGEKLGTPWNRFVLGVKRLFEGLKSVLGFNNKYAVHKYFNDLIEGKVPRSDKQREMITDYLTQGKFKTTFLSNIEDDERLLDEVGAPKVKMHLRSTAASLLVDSWASIKEAAQRFKSNPINEAFNLLSSAVDKTTAVRIAGFDYTAGLRARDAERTKGLIRYNNGQVMATLAVNNYLHSAYIAARVLTEGGLEFNKDYNQIMAVKRNKSMKNIIVLQNKLINKLGANVGTRLVQQYLIAKRTRSIQNTFLTRQAMYEMAKDDYAKDKSEEMRQTFQQAEEDYKDIVKAYKAIPREMCERNEDGTRAIHEINGEKLPILNDDVIDRFIERDTVHPELAEIMDNWTSVNHNLLDMLAFSGRISEARAEQLKEIKDYVPWQRDMEEEMPLEGSPRRKKTLGITAFSGKETDLDVDNIIERMQSFIVSRTMSSIRNYAENRIAKEYATRNEKGKIIVFPHTGQSADGVRFPVYINGRRVIVEVEDTLVADALHGMVQAPVEFDFKPLLSGVANFTRRAITFTFVFQAKQAFKDAPAAAWLSGTKHPFLQWANSLKRFVQLLPPGSSDQIVNAMHNAGFGGFLNYRPAAHEYEHQIGAMTGKMYDKAISAIDHVADASDMSPRHATYTRILAETGDPTLALYMASEIMDFQKRGKSKVAQAVRTLTPFIQTWATQFDGLAQAVAAPGNLRGRENIKARAMFIKTGLSLAAAWMMWTLLCMKDPDYDELTDDQKLRNMYIPFSKKYFGHHVLIPMNTTPAFFFKAWPQLYLERRMKEATKDKMDQRRFDKAFSHAFVEQVLGPEPIPAGARPFAEITLNRNFYTEGPVTPDYMKDWDPAIQYNYSTSEAGKKLSAITKIPGTNKRMLNPMEADVMIRDLFGSAGAIAQWYSNEIWDSNRVAPQARENLLYGSFLSSDVQRKQEDLFYDLKDATDEAQKTFMHYMNDGRRAEGEQYKKENMDLIQGYGYTNRIDQSLKKINSNIRRIGDNPSDIAAIDTQIDMVKEDKGLSEQEKAVEIKTLMEDKAVVQKNMISKDRYSPEEKRRQINYFSEKKNDVLKDVVKWRNKVFADNPAKANGKK